METNEWKLLDKSWCNLTNYDCSSAGCAVKVSLTFRGTQYFKMLIQCQKRFSRSVKAVGALSFVKVSENCKTYLLRKHVAPFLVQREQD